jgi:hypothetical protein
VRLRPGFTTGPSVAGASCTNISARMRSYSARNSYPLFEDPLVEALGFLLALRLHSLGREYPRDGMCRHGTNHPRSLGRNADNTNRSLHKRDRSRRARINDASVSRLLSGSLVGCGWRSGGDFSQSLKGPSALGRGSGGGP